MFHYFFSSKSEIRSLQARFDQDVEKFKLKQRQEHQQLEDKNIAELDQLAKQNDCSKATLEKKLNNVENDLTKQLQKKQLEYGKLQKQFEEQCKKNERKLAIEINKKQKQHTDSEQSLETDQSNSNALSDLTKTKDNWDEKTMKIRQKQEDIEQQTRDLKAKYEKQQKEERDKWDAKISQAMEKLKEQQQQAVTLTRKQLAGQLISIKQSKSHNSLSCHLSTPPPSYVQKCVKKGVGVGCSIKVPLGELGKPIWST